MGDILCHSCGYGGDGPTHAFNCKIWMRQQLIELQDRLDKLEKVADAAARFKTAYNEILAFPFRGQKLAQLQIAEKILDTELGPALKALESDG